MTTIGYATLQIIPSLKGVSAEINKQLAAMPDAGTAAGKKIGKEIEAGVGKGAEDAAGQVKSRLSERLGTQVGSVVGKGIGAGIKLGIAGGAAVAAAAVGGIGIALTKGFDRLKSIDEATFKLKALGHSANETKQIMDNALASVKGTAFGLQDAATAAASAVAAGIKPGQDLTKYLKEVGDAAAVAGTNFTDMGAIFGKIQTSNKAYTDDLNQLADRGLPIFQWLQTEYGVTADKLSEMVQKGEVDSAHFQDAIDKNIGGAAQKMGQSFDGAVDNLEASVARLGANFITAVLGGDPANALQGPTQAIGALTDKFDDIGKWVNAHSGEIHAFFEDVRNVAAQAAGAVKDISTWLVQNKGAAEDLAAVFVGWKVLSVLSDAATKARGVATALGFIGPAASAAGTEAAAGLAPLTAVLGPIVAMLAAIKVGTPYAEDFADKYLPHPGGAPHGFVGLDPFQLLPQKPGTNAPVGPLPKGSANPTPFDPYPLPIPRASGGSISGPGTGTSDSILARLSNGEHVWTANEVNKIGGQAAMYRLRALARIGKLKGFSGGGDIQTGVVIWPPEKLGPINKKLPGGVPDHGPGVGGSIGFPDWSAPGQKFGPPPGDWWLRPVDPNDVLFPDAVNPGKRQRQKEIWDRLHPQTKLFGFSGGGAVGPDVLAAQDMVGTPYSKDARYDCSGSVARVIDRALGLPEAGLMTTKTAQKWLADRGFKPGIGGPGMISVGWYDHGPGENDGHMAMTLSDGRHAEAGGSHRTFLIGAGAAGADSPQFDQHMFLPTLYGEGKPGSSESPFAGGSVAAAVGAAPPIADGGSSSAPSGGGISLPSSLSGLATMGLGGLGQGVGTTGSGSDLSLFSNAAASAVGGQVDSLLGVFGAGGSPPWLQAASKLLSGIKVSGKDGTPIFDGSNLFGSAAPLAATSTGMGTMPPDDAGNMHGGRAGQAPGPVTNIYAQDAEGALVKWQRLQDQRAAAKLSYL